MWSNNIKKIATTVINSEVNFNQQIRTTFVLKRRWEPSLHKKDAKPRPLRGRHFVYDLIKDTNIEKQPDINLILTSYVAGYGNVGDKIAVKATVAYNQLLLPGLAAYATPDNLRQYENENKDDIKETHSSAFAQRTINIMSNRIFSVIMNKDVPWTLETWHIRASLRKAGYHVAEEAIELPKKPISGPDLSIQSKDFYVTITINNVEKFKIRCRIHHWSTKITDRLPYVFEHWKLPFDPIFPEEPEEKIEIKPN